MRKKSYPIISVIIPTLNEEKNIKRCLSSIFRQTYPKKRLEVIIVDDSSTDKTVNIAKKYPVKIIVHNNKHGEIGKMIGFRNASGKYAIYIDADVELKGTMWFQKMVKPLEENGTVIGSFTRKYSRKSDPPLERYYALDPLQRDIVYKMFSPSIKSVIKEKHKDYFVLEYKENRIPPACRVLYRRKELLKEVKNYNMFLELDFLVVMTKKGFNKFAYVSKAGLYHHHAKSLKELIRKRKYNIRNVYLKTYEKKLYKWFDLKNLIDLFKIVLLIVYSNTIFPGVIVGLYKSIKYKDWAGMYEPVVSLFITDIIIWEFLNNPSSVNLLKN